MHFLHRAVGIISALLVSYLLQAQNPITPPGIFIADPEAHLWNDGRLYIYGSRDESDDYWCSHSYHVLSTEDLVNWQLDMDVFASNGARDQVPDHDKLLFAPDVAFKDGSYFLYYCSPGDPKTEGVATSKFPTGPFTNGKQIMGAWGIDPAVLIDYDGQGYYYWGQGNAKVARLKTNMIEIDTSDIRTPLDAAGAKAFHEGSSIRKVGDWYYLVFADDSRQGRPTCLGYAMSKSPLGPFEYKGIIIDNFGSDPSAWNNHGSIELFDDQWYVFYHRPTNNSRKFRKACVEPIYFREDGTIKEVEMTTQGALGKPLKAKGLHQAESACLLQGNVCIKTDFTSDLPVDRLAAIKSGDWAAYKYIDFSEAVTSFRIKTRQSTGGTVELRLGSPSGVLIATCSIQPSQDDQVSEVSLSKYTNGVHALYLVFRGQSDELFEIDWFQFF
ncbi:MAG: family 43 glycosylhydrolase [Bacteroidota bacterium]